jgi:hypothetical protein
MDTDAELLGIKKKKKASAAPDGAAAAAAAAAGTPGEAAAGEGGAGDAAGPSGQAEEEMVTPEVNDQFLAEMRDMGFPDHRAIRALHCSGNST